MKRLLLPQGLIGGIVSFVIIVLIWAGATAVHVAPAILFPSPLVVLQTFVGLITANDLWIDLAVSFQRVWIAFILSVLTALPVGLLMGLSRPAASLLEPPISFIRYMPVVAFVPLTLVWVGIDESQKYLLIWIGTFFTQALMFMDNFRRVPRDLVNVGLTLGFTPRKQLTRIVLPWAGPGIWDTMRITLGAAWSWLLLAELFAANIGVGHRILIAQRYLHTAEIFVLILMIGVIGLLMDLAFKTLEKRIFSWTR